MKRFKVEKVGDRYQIWDRQTKGYVKDKNTDYIQCCRRKYDAVNYAAELEMADAQEENEKQRREEKIDSRRKYGTFEAKVDGKPVHSSFAHA